jgi:hypothetical protein
MISWLCRGWCCRQWPRGPKDEIRDKQRYNRTKDAAVDKLFNRLSFENRKTSSPSQGLPAACPNIGTL